MRGLAYITFYRMPLPVRRGLAKMISPRYVVGAVTILRDSEAAAGDGPDRVLLLRQPHRGGWGLPAGLLKRREQPVVGAARELLEETGVRVDPADMTAGSPNAIIHVVGVVDTVFFASVPAATTPLRVDGAEVLEARWFPVADLPHLSANTAYLLGRYGIGPQAK